MKEVAGKPLGLNPSSPLFSSALSLCAPIAIPQQAAMSEEVGGRAKSMQNGFLNDSLLTGYRKKKTNKHPSRGSDSMAVLLRTPESQPEIPTTI